MKKLYGNSLRNYVMTTKLLSFIMALLCMLGTTQIFAQGSATWNLTTSNTPVLCGSLTASGPVAGSLVANVTSVNATSGYSGTGFSQNIGPANYNNNATGYFQYAVTNGSAGAINFSSITIGAFYDGPIYMYFAVRYSTDNFATSTLYTSAQQVNNGTIVLTGTTNITVNAGATLRYRVYGYYTDGSAYRFGNTLFQVTATPLPPAAFTATPVNTSQINLNATANAVGSNVMLVFNTVNTFGTPAQGTNYVAGNTIPGGGTVLYIGAAGNPFFNHTGLVQGATYYYQLYSVLPACKVYSTPLAANATTLCPAFALPFTEGFNTPAATTFPPCWTQQAVSGSSAISFQTSSTNPTTTPQEGSRFVYWNSYGFSSGNQTRLVSPRINTVGTGSVNALFYWYHDNTALYNGSAYALEGMTLQYSLDGAIWNDVQFIPRALAGKNGWTAYDITLPAPAGNSATLQVGFRFNSVFGDNCSMDNLTVYPTPTCKIPNTPLTSSSITLTSATITWAASSTAPGIGYEYYYSTSAIPPTPATTPNGSSPSGVTSVGITGLNQNSVYYFWVRSRCSASDTSPWIGPGSFETLSLYCSSTTTSPATYYINQVSFVGTLQDVSNVSTYSANGYQNFTGLTPKSRQAQGEGMNVYVQSNFSVLMKAWVDWNGNAVFDDPSELVYTTNGTITSTTTFGFIVPPATVPGDYIIRIRTTYSGASTYGPCGSLGNGETEDYTFTVVPTCSAQISAVGDGETCGPGPVILSAAGSTGTSEYRWYANATGGASLAVTTTGVWTTPSISATTVYYVTAYNGCESLVRTPITAKLSTVPVLSFTPTAPVVCGEGAVLQLNASGDTEEGILIFEKFTGGLGTFTVNNILINPAVSTGNAQWQSKANTYVPTNTTTWHPAISSGFGTNSFVYTSSDFNPLPLGTGTEVNSALVSASVNTTGYTSLSLNFDFFFSHYLPDGTNTIIDSVVVEVSIDGGTAWTNAASYITDQGIGTRFKNNTVPLNAYINVANLKIRFRYHGKWTDGAAIDNVKLSGQKPLSTSFSWTPTSNGNLFTDATGSTPYTGGPVPNVFIRPTPAQLASGAALNFTATATLSNGCSASTPVTVTIGPSQWLGTVAGGDWFDINNWCSKTVPTATTVVEIPAGTPFPPVINAAANAAKIKIYAGGTLTINTGGSITVPGTFNNLGTLTNNGKIVLSGTAAGTQSFPGLGTILAMKNLEINNTGGGVNLDQAIFIENELKPTAGIVVLSNFDITLRSVGAGTAAVSAVGPTAGFTYTGSGRFVVERYIPTGVTHGKSWQLLAAPTNGQTIKASWMENGASTSGYGTQVPGIPGTGGGFDATALLPAMKTYVPSTNTFVEVGNPNTTAINNGQGYFIFIRGDRTVVNFSGPNSTPLPTVLRSKGAIRIGPVSSPTATAGLFQSVANPYPSAVDFSTITRTGGVDPNFYVYDPTLQGTQGLGGYQTITAATGYKATPGNFSTTSTIYNTTSNYKTIQSGQAFLIRATGTGGQLQFKEADKASGSSLVNRGAQVNSMNEISMFSTNFLIVNGNTLKLADGNRVVLGNQYQNGVDGNDAAKINNTGGNFGLLRNGVSLAVEARRNPVTTDTVFYNMTGFSSGSYRLMFVPENIDFSGALTAELIDNFLNTRTQVSLSDTNYVDMQITADANSNVADRFKLVFTRLAGPLPVTITHIAAERRPGKTIKVDWEVENEINIEKYVVERSSDGRNFKDLLNISATNVHSYSQIDNAPFEADNFYRIRALGLDNYVEYSKIVKVGIVQLAESITVFPNPIEGKNIQVKFTNKKYGKYILRLFDKAGQVVYNGNAQVLGLNYTKTIGLNSAVATGIYQLTVSGTDGKVTNVQVLIK